jgi:hypothetical protein
MSTDVGASGAWRHEARPHHTQRLAPGGTDSTVVRYSLGATGFALRTGVPVGETPTTVAGGSWSAVVAATRWRMDLHAAPGLSAEGRGAIEATQAAINAWGGAIGEALGVATFAAIWAIATSLLILRDRRLPAWAGVAGLAAGALVALPGLELFGMTPPVSIVLSTTGIQLWFMALGGLFVWRAWPRPT